MLPVMEEIRNLLPSDFMQHVPSVADDWLADTGSIRSVLPTLVEGPSDGIAVGRQSFLFAAAGPFAMQAKALLVVNLDVIDFHGLNPGSGFGVGGILADAKSHEIKPSARRCRNVGEPSVAPVVPCNEGRRNRLSPTNGQIDLFYRRDHERSIADTPGAKSDDIPQEHVFS